jgi:hypothetical protein
LPSFIKVGTIAQMLVSPDNYDELRLWFGRMVALAMPDVEVGSDIDPIRVVDGFANKAPAKARASLTLAIGDLVELTGDWPDDRVVSTDQEFLAAGLPTLSEVRALFSRTISRVVRRGSIRSDVEYHSVRNAAERPGEHQAMLWSLIEAYEAKQPSDVR